MHFNQVNIQAFVGRVRSCGTTIWISHVAGEDYVLPVPANGRSRGRPVAFGAPRARMRQAVGRSAINTRKNDLVLVELPIARGRRLKARVAVEELGPCFPVVEKGQCGPGL